MRPMAVRRVLSRTKPGRIPTKVIGVCGMSCSGKSTVSSVLQAHAAQYKAHVPLICLDDSFYEWMFDAPARDQPTSLAPPGGGGRLWKNWESRRCIDWRHLMSKLRAKVAVHSGYTPYIVVEGFLLLEDAAVLAQLDHVVSIEVSKEVAWQRRLSRALAMADGSEDASGMDNYEQLHVYALERDFERIHADAAATVARLGRGAVFPRAHEAAARTRIDLSRAGGAYDWLRLYFEEVIWPEASTVHQHVQEVRAHTPGKVFCIDGDQSAAGVEKATRQVIASIFNEGAF